MKVVRTIIEWVDGVLDRIPSYEDGRWYRGGCWGCRMQMWRLWDHEEEDRT